MRPVRAMTKNLRRGRIQRTLAAATAVSAVALGVEIYFEHYKASFGDRWMWAPLVATPPLVGAGVAGVFSERAARTLLPVASAVYAANGVIGVVTHVRGVLQKPGGLREPLYNLVMGPPLLAPGSLTAVGAMGVAAAVANREQ